LPNVSLAQILTAMTDADAILTIAPKLAGSFIVLDGPDGAGKSTQLSLLADAMTAAGVEVCRLRDPGGTTIGDRIREILLDRKHEAMSVECELMLYMASRAQLAAEHIRPALAAGKCVLCDRFISSTIAYQGAGGADIETIRRIGQAAVGDAWPDLTIVLDIDVEVGMGRLSDEPDRMESKSLSFHRQVREVFLQQAADDPARFAVVDARTEIQRTHAHVLGAIAAWAQGR